MKKTAGISYWFYVWMGLLAFGCGKKAGFIEPLFDTEIGLQQNLVFRFDRKMVDYGSIGKWDTATFLVIQPKTKGKFKWTAPDELVFSPDNGFEFATHYSAFPGPALTKANAETTKETAEIHFHSPFLKVESAAASWVSGENNSKNLHIRLTFNTRIFPSDLEKALKLSHLKKPVAFSIPRNIFASEVLLELKNAPSDLEIGNAIELSLGTELNKNKRKYKVKEVQNTLVNVPSIKELVLSSKTFSPGIGTGVVNLVWSQPITDSVLQEAISIEPKTEITVKSKGETTEILGAFNQNVAYTFTISSGLQGLFGGTNQKEIEFSVGELVESENIAFADKQALYLPKNGKKEIGIYLEGTDIVQVEIYKVYENNILACLRNRRDYGYDDAYEDLEQYGDVVYINQFSKKALKQSGKQYLLPLDFNSFRNEKGIYLAKIYSDEQRWVSDTKLICITDLGLLVKEADDEIRVFVHSLETNQPVKGTEIQLISKANQLIHTQTTNSQGMAVFENIPRNKSPRTEAIFASHESDFSFLYFNNTMIEAGRYDVGGVTRNDAGLVAFLYGERNLYRPGETVQMNVVLRHEGYQTPLPQMLHVKIQDPVGNLYQLKSGMTNEEGSFVFDFVAEKQMPTGSYMVEVYDANQVLLTSKSISVEDFLPDRLSVRFLNEIEKVYSGQKIQLKVMVENLFGGSVNGNAYQTVTYVSPEDFYSEKFPEYSFYQNGFQNNTIYLPDQNGNVDQKGNISIVLQVPDSLKDIGILNGRTEVSIFDETGRPITRSKTYKVITQNLFPGIKSNLNALSIGRPNLLEFIALNENEVPQNAKFYLRILKKEWYNVLEAQQSKPGNPVYVSKEREIVMKEQWIDLKSGFGKLNFTPVQNGDYEVRLYASQSAKSFVSKTYYAYSMPDSELENADFSIKKEGEVEITAEKTAFIPGEKGEILFRTPFDGNLLVTLEHRKIIQSFYLKTANKIARLSLKTDESMLPNVYVSATLIRPLHGKGKKLPYMVAYGYKSLEIKDPAMKGEIEILTPETTGSMHRQNIQIQSKSAKDMEITIAAVDEGILSMSNYESPDIYAYYFQKRALSINSFSMYGLVFEEYPGKATGGDGEAKMMAAGGFNPMIDQNGKIFSRWSKTLRLPARGKINWTLDIPQFSGAVRLMVVGYGSKTFAKAEKLMKVKDDIVASLGLPRFLAPGDQLSAPLTFFNTTASSKQFTYRLSQSGPVSIVSGSTGTFKLKPYEQLKVEVGIQTTGFTQKANLALQLHYQTKTFSYAYPLAITTPFLKETQTFSGIIPGNKSIPFAVPSDFLKGTGEATMLVSGSPLLLQADKLKKLLEYPYGCVEQVVSAAFPQLYFPELTASFQAIQDPGIQKYLAGKNVAAAIRQLSNALNYQGEFEIWGMGSGVKNDWVNVYATHFLVEAKNAGFEVDDYKLNNALNNLSNLVRASRKIKVTIQKEPGKNTVQEFISRPVAYAIYVLTKAGIKELGVMAFLKSNPGMLTTDSRVFLACAYLNGGDVESFARLMPSGFAASNVVEEPETYASGLRDYGIMLATLAETDPANPRIAYLTQQLNALLKREMYPSTQELAFALLGLGKVAKAQSQVAGQPTVTFNQKPIGKKANGQISIGNEILNKTLTLTSGNKGNVYYFGYASGVPLKGTFTEKDQMIQVRRTYTDRTGKVLNPNQLSINQQVTVQITLKCLGDNMIGDVAVTDMIPACLEPENASLSNKKPAPLKDARSIFDHNASLRDDRVHFFTNAYTKEMTYYYQARVIAKGQFKLAPIKAEAMYQPEWFSLSGSGKVLVGNQVTEKEKEVL